jgi:serine/threonine-protein kinase
MKENRYNKGHKARLSCRKEGSIVEATEANKTVTLFDRYRLIRPLGNGGQSKVYLAEHIKLKAYRVIKCIPKQFGSSSSFNQEIHILKSLKHPGLPEIFDLEEDAEYLYLIEEYLEGISLQEYFEIHKNISQRELIEIGVELCAIVQYLHERQPYPILYLDFKPEHIFYCNGQWKLIDFGISQILTDTKTDYMPYGTRGFAAPEQHDTKVRTVQTDIYGLAAVLYYLSEGHPPDTGGDGWTEPTFRRTKEKMARLLWGALQKNIDERYASVQELHDRLVQLQKEENSSLKASYKIAVIGSQERVGTTHISVAVANYLQKNGRSAAYIARSNPYALAGIRQYEKELGRGENAKLCGYVRDGDLAQDRYIAADMLVIDYGSYEKEMEREWEDADLKLIVIGLKPWERQYSEPLIKRFRYQKDTIFLANFASEREVRERRIREPAAMEWMPYFPDPFVSGERKWAKYFHFLKTAAKGRR